jgi:DNA mismatch repair protein MutS
VVIAGFRDYNLDRYIQSIVDANFTAVVYAQKELSAGRMTRELSGTFSPGTFLPADTDSNAKMTNNVLCLWIDKYNPLLNRLKERIVCGAAVVNIFTGESKMFEYETELEMVPATFDALERFASTHAPSETIFVSPFSDENVSRRVLQYLGISSRVVHLIPQQQPNGGDEDVRVLLERCRQQKYVRHILSAFFREDTYEVCEEFRQYVVATQSYCYLLHFIQERNPNLVRNIVLPKFDNTTKNMVLANHTLRQLNIIDDGTMDVTDARNLRSVGAFLNKCCSAVGRRRFYGQLTHPTFDEEWLNREYDAVAKLLENAEMIDAFRKLIREVADLEKIARQLIVRKLNPDSILRLYKSALAIQQIHVCLFESRELCEYFVDGVASLQFDAHKIVEEWIVSLLSFISANLIVERCEGCQSVTSFEDNIIKAGVSDELDALLSRMEENERLFQEIRKTFNGIMSKMEKSSSSEFVRVHETDKSGAFLHLTKRRSALLKKYLAERPNATIAIPHGKSTVSVNAADIQLTSAGASNDAIEFPLLNSIIREKLTIRDTINSTICKAYSVFLERLETNCLPTIEKLANFIARVDVLQSKAYVAKTYGYCRPVIDDAQQTKNSRVDARGLRHCLIEHIQTQELYVANDVCLSKSEDSTAGILLYGTNAVGKTSLIRALGIAVIMAQSGMYVPCSAFSYRPYRAIFTRILGNDNLFKNLSMFAVEMSELRVILNSADKNSLVLGDELCSGTETESALSIFASGLTDLHRLRSTFLFATHFHEILKFDEIQALKRLSVKHMAVHYDRERDCLVYDRVLRDGAGNRLYGLEVAKSLHLPDEFIERAYKIRNKYFPEMRGELSSPTTRYNANKIRSMCENCKLELASETHHLQEQKWADEDGRVDGIDVNHVANLMSLCEKCHFSMHQVPESASPPIPFLDKPSSVKQKPKIVRKKTTAGYIVEPR